MTRIKDIAIYGSGGLGREVACLINLINSVELKWNLVGFFDDNPSMKGKRVSHYGLCLGGIKELNSLDEPLAVILAIGDSLCRKSVFDKIDNKKISFPNLIHPNSGTSDMESFSIGRGNIIQGGCSATCDIHIGNFNVLNGDVFLGHDTEIGSFNSFMPAVKISGGVTMGNCNYCGVGSIVIQNIKIGNDVRLGAGSVLMTAPKDGCLYLGVPALKTEF